jgi:hypothetical protein
MKDLCIPLPGISEEHQADVLVFIGDKKIEYHYRVESFPWISTELVKSKKVSEKDLVLQRIKKLKTMLSEYNKEWEIVQIYEPKFNSNFIQVLYRKKN